MYLIRKLRAPDNEKAGAETPKEEVTKSEKGPSNVELAKALNDLKANSVSKEEYEKLEKENRELIDQIANLMVDVISDDVEYFVIGGAKKNPELVKDQFKGTRFKVQVPVREILAFHERRGSVIGFHLVHFLSVKMVEMESSLGVRRFAAPEGNREPLFLFGVEQLPRTPDIVLGIGVRCELVEVTHRKFIHSRGGFKDLFQPCGLFGSEGTFDNSAVKICRRKDISRRNHTHHAVVVANRGAVRLSPLERKVGKCVVRGVLPQNEGRVVFLRSDEIIASAVSVRSRNHFHIETAPA